jgi:hypothetical protein
MRPALTGRLLLTLGLLVGAAASVGLLLDFGPARLPPALLNLAAYKLTFAAAFGLLGGGAMFLRYARRTDTRETSALPPAARGPERAPPVPGIADPAPPAFGVGADGRDVRKVIQETRRGRAD